MIGMYLELMRVGVSKISKLVTEVEASWASTRACIKAAQKVGQGDKARNLPLLFELLNVDDMLKSVQALLKLEWPCLKGWTNLLIEECIIFHYTALIFTLGLVLILPG